MTVVDQVDAPPAEGPSTPFRGPNKEKARARSRRYYNRHRERLNSEGRARRLGIPVTEIAHQLKVGVCAVCGDLHPTVVDADRESTMAGLVRGVLCRRCAATVGFVRALSPEHRKALMEYVG